MSDSPTLKAAERTIFGKKVKQLRADGIIPAHVFGNKVETESVQLNLKDFTQTYKQVGTTGLINLKIGEERVRPVLIREIQYHGSTGFPLNIDFYQVNLKEKVRVYVPIELIGEELEIVHSGEAVILQPLSEVEIEVLPTDLIDKIEVNTSVLKNIDDAITVADLNYDRTKIEIFTNPEEVVVKLAPAVTEEMQQLMEEQDAEAAAAQEATESEATEGEKTPEDGEETATEGGEDTSATEGEEKAADTSEETAG